jgi:hypothetical protein
MSPRVEGAVIRGGAKRHQQLSVKTKGGDAVADALFSLGRRRLDSPAKLLKRLSLLVAQACEELVDGGWFI